MDNTPNNSVDHWIKLFVHKMLLKAVLREDIEKVKRLVKYPGLNLNHRVTKGNTLLLQSLRVKNEPIIMSLLHAGCDVNISNDDKETPLHVVAMLSLPINFAHELVKRGANIEAVDIRGRTPLCTAVFYGNVAVVYMLLYNGADVNVACNENMTPFMWTLHGNRVEVSKILFNYYDDFSCVDVDGKTASYFATTRLNPIAVNILKAGTGKNENCDALLINSVKYSTAEVFKLIWSKFKEKICLNDDFLISYLYYCNFSNSEWSECWHLLFKSSTAFEHLQQGKTVNRLNKKEIFLMAKFLQVLYHRKIESKDRLALIYLFLSFGIEATIDSINLVYLFYGFNEELEAFIYTINNEHKFERYAFLPLPRLIVLWKDEYQMGIHLIGFAYYLYADYFEKILVDGKMEQDVIIEALNFCSLPYTRKQWIKKACQKFLIYYQYVIEKLDAVSEVPSLLELCRNETRKLLIKSGKIKKSYQFHDIVKELNLPLRIQDIIRLKIPIY